MDLKEIALHSDENRHPWELARLRVIKTELASMGYESEKTVKVLDVGCGDTYLIEELSKTFSNMDFSAVDIAFTDEMVEYYRIKHQNNPISVYQHLDELEGGFEGQADLVLLLDVIEHIEDDIAFMKTMSKYSFIGPQTQFLITVPAYQSLFCQHDVFLDHYRRYNNKMLKEHLAISGYRTTQLNYFFLSLLPPRVIEVIFEKWFNKKNDRKGISAWKGSDFSTQFVSGVLTFDYRFFRVLSKLGIKVPGLSNLAICRLA